MECYRGIANVPSCHFDAHDARSSKMSRAPRSSLSRGMLPHWRSRGVLKVEREALVERVSTVARRNGGSSK